MATTANIAIPTPEGTVPDAAGHEGNTNARGKTGGTLRFTAPSTRDLDRELLQKWTIQTSAQAGISGPAFMNEALQTLCNARSTAPERRRALDQAEGLIAGAKHPAQTAELTAALERIRMELPQQDSGRSQAKPTRARPPCKAKGSPLPAAKGDAGSAEPRVATLPMSVAPAICMVKAAELRTQQSFAGLFPVGEKILETLAESMRAGGYDPTWPMAVWDKVVVDGHTRLSAARRAGIEVVPVVMHHFSGEAQALEYAIRCQANRRNLTDAELLRCVQALDKRRSAQESGRQGRAMQLGGTQECAPPAGPSSAATAAMLGISQRKVEQVRTVMDHAAPEVKAAVQSGDLTMNAAYGATQRARSPKPLTIPVAVASADPTLPAQGLHVDKGGYEGKAQAGCGELPCPFCGGVSGTQPDGSRRRRNPEFRVVCVACSATGPVVSSMGREKPYDTEGMRREAIARWNLVPRRPQWATEVPPNATVDSARVDRFFDQLWVVLDAKPREEWPDAIRAMQRVIARAGAQEEHA